MIKRTNSKNPDFLKLNAELDAALAITDGADHPFYAQYNKIDSIKYIVVAYENELPVGCGAIKEYGRNVFEIKRMYVPELCRGKGIATKILHELENWAKEIGAKKCILETGYKQLEAIALYKKNSYHIILNYGQYEGVENSICFEKIF